MKSISIFLITFSFSFSFAQTPCIYPPTERQNIVDTIWHKVVEDPYRWLEDIHSEKTNEWLKNQKAIRDKYGGKLSDIISEHITNYHFIQSKNVSKEGPYYFSSGISRKTESSSLYYSTTIDETPRVLFDPNLLAKPGTISIDGITLSEDFKTLALALAKNGSDWKTIRFLDVETKRLLEDSLQFVKYNQVYWSDNGVFYIQYDVQNESESFEGKIKIKALQYHKLGTKQSDDLIVFKPENENDEFQFEVTSGGRYLVLGNKKLVNEKLNKFLAIKSLPLKKDDEFKEILRWDAKGIYFDVIGELKDKLLVKSNQNARNGVLYICDPSKLNKFEKFIPQYKEQLKTVSIVNDNKIVALYNGDKRSYAVVYDSSGTKLKSWTIPEGFSFDRLTYSRGDSVLLYYFDSFFNPSSVYKVNLNTFEQEPVIKTIVPFSFSNLTTEKVYFYSKDSTQIPMYLTHKKNIKLDGNNPTILYGYGGFGSSMNPFFDVNNIVFLNSGGLLAVPQLRGGGDFPDWHEQGRRLKKQNTFNDFISAAEFLIREKYTSSEKIAAMGGSHGGLVVGACMTQRPDLFKVVVSKSGVLDMMRYHLYNVGSGNRRKSEYGNITDSIDFENLIRYSPVQNVKKGIDYPATLLVASDNDDRVNPFQSFKFISELQSSGTSKNPYVLYYVENAGHGGSRVFDERIKTDAYIYSFIYKYLGMEKKIYFED